MSPDPGNSLRRYIQERYKRKRLLGSIRLDDLSLQRYEETPKQSEDLKPVGY
jgi:hypothetical protein